MSRRCPKRYHLFLNWLKTNRQRFIFKPFVVRTENSRIILKLRGITAALHFEYYCRLSPQSCSWLSVDTVVTGKEREGLARFFGAEVLTPTGWITLRQPEEERCYWQTREELWTELCFEAFLEWCNRELTLSVEVRATRLLPHL